MKHALSASSTATASERRSSDRRAASLPGFMTWRDRRGTTRFASMVVRNISDYGAFVECDSATVIPLFRLVTLQLDHGVSGDAGVPEELCKAGRVLGAVYRRVMPGAGNGLRQGYAVRLMIDPDRVNARARVMTFGRRVRSIA